MNKDRRQGYLAGLLTAALALGLGGAALAAGRTIQVEDGVSVTLNGVPFTPKNAGGEEVPIFAYDGTIYAPVRAFAKAAGLGVDYDADTRTARIETPDYAASADPASGDYLTADRAREIALADAGVSAGDALFLKAGLDWEDGRAVYDVEFCAGAGEYDYELDALTGEILKRERELEDFDWSHHDGYRIHHGEDHHDSHHSASDGAYLTADRAREIALADAGVAAADVFRKTQLDWEDGRAVYEVEFTAGTREYDYELDAVSGQVLKKDVDDNAVPTAPEGLISADRAKELALARLPGGTVVQWELDDDNGRWKYELELRLGAAEYDCVLDGTTGEVLKWKLD